MLPGEEELTFVLTQQVVIKVALFHLPSGTPLLTWRELSKQEWDNWTIARLEELNRLHAAAFSQTVTRGGETRKVAICIRAKYLCCDHHQLWSELGTRDCEQCKWARPSWLDSFFCTQPLSLSSFGKKCRFHGLRVAHLDRVSIVQPVLHNLKGVGSRLVSMIGRILPSGDSLALLHFVATQVPRYGLPTGLPLNAQKSKQVFRFKKMYNLSHNISCWL